MMNTWHTPSGIPPPRGGQRIGGKRRAPPSANQQRRKYAKNSYSGGALMVIKEEEEEEMDDLDGGQQISEGEMAPTIPTNTPTTTTSVAHLHGEHNCLLRTQFQRKLHLRSPSTSSGEEERQLAAELPSSSPSLCEMKEMEQENHPQLAAKFNSPAGMRQAPTAAPQAPRSVKWHDPICCQIPQRQIACVEPTRRAGGAAIIRRDTNITQRAANERMANNLMMEAAELLKLARLEVEVAEQHGRAADEHRLAANEHRLAANEHRLAADRHGLAADEQSEKARRHGKAAALEREAIMKAAAAQRQLAPDAPTAPLAAPTTSAATNQQQQQQRSATAAAAEVAALGDVLREVLAGKMAEPFSGELAALLKQVECGVYADVWEMLEAVSLLLDESRPISPLVRKEPTPISRLRKKVLDDISQRMGEVTTTLGYCCGSGHRYMLFPLFCAVRVSKKAEKGKKAEEGEKAEEKDEAKEGEKAEEGEEGEEDEVCSRCIQPNNEYTCCKLGEGDAVKEFACCNTCYEDEARIELSFKTSGGVISVRKDSKCFSPMVHTQREVEQYLHCKVCDRRWHQICATNTNRVDFATGVFTCRLCRIDRGMRAEEINPYTAKDLPECDLSVHMEQRVKSLLAKKGLTTPPEVLVRVLTSTDEKMVTKPRMKARYSNFPAEFPYTLRAILVFSRVEGGEVLFFMMYTQEYGPDAKQPNRDRVYFSYLDTVWLTEERRLGTEVKEQLILAYFDHVRKRGYKWVHIWSQIPGEGVEYVFRGHPPHQKFSSNADLLKWYTKLLEKGKKEGIVAKFLTLKHMMSNNCAPTALPYFDGNYWPGELEELVKKAPPIQLLPPPTATASQRRSKAEDPMVGELRKALAATNKAKNSNNFLVVDLVASGKQQPSAAATGEGSTAAGAPATEGPTTDDGTSQQPPPPNELIYRSVLLDRSSDERWEWSTDRHNIYSTTRFVHALHASFNAMLGMRRCTTHTRVAAVWHCSTCKEVHNACGACYDAGTTTGVDQLHSWQKVHALATAFSQEAVRACLETLVHVCGAAEDHPNCAELCGKMRALKGHECTVGKADCINCHQWDAIRRCHAQRCAAKAAEGGCVVPNCSQAKGELEEQRSRRSHLEDKEAGRRSRASNVGDLETEPIASTEWATAAEEDDEEQPEERPSDNTMNPPTAAKEDDEEQPEEHPSDNTLNPPTATEGEEEPGEHPSDLHHPSGIADENPTQQPSSSSAMGGSAAATRDEAIVKLEHSFRSSTMNPPTTTEGIGTGAAYVSFGREGHKSLRAPSSGRVNPQVVAQGAVDTAPPAAEEGHWKRANRCALRGRIEERLRNWQGSGAAVPKDLLDILEGLTTSGIGDLQTAEIESLARQHGGTKWRRLQTAITSLATACRGGWK